MKMKIAIYTAVFGGFDRLLEQSFCHPIVDFIYFTDQDIESKTWEVRKIPLWNNDPLKTSKKLKIQPHLFLPEYDYTLWIDGNITVSEDILQPFEVMSQYNMDAVFFKHPETNSFYDECKHVISLGKTSENEVNRHIDKYKNEKYLGENGQIETNLIWRKNNSPHLEKTMNCWWEQLETLSIRDQLGIMYSFWKEDFIFKKNYLLLSSIKENQTRLFHRFPHSKDLEKIGPNHPIGSGKLVSWV